MSTPAVTPPIEGLPPGAIVRPISPAAAAQPPIEGLPPGAIVKPITGYQGPMTSTGIAAPQGTSTAGEAWNALKDTVSDLGTGAAQGAANTVGSSIAGTARLLRHLPYMNRVIPESGIQALEAQTAERSSPENTTQAIGKGAEQVGEFMLPGAGEEEATARALPYLSRLGPLAKPLARIGYQAATTGAVNAAQGGSPTAGAVTGAIGGGIGEGLRAAAPAVAESALGITKRMRGYGKTPGVAALEETSGLLPGTIEKQANAVNTGLTSKIQNMAAAHQGSVSLQPAIDVIDNEISKATAQNNAQAVQQLNNVRDALTKNITTGQPIPVDQTATGALDLKRGLRNQFIKNWNPEISKGPAGFAAQRGSGAIDQGLDTALGPDFQSANQRVSSLIPVAERSESLERDPSLAQKAAQRMAAHTGALIGSAALGTAGYQKAGIPGAVGGVISGAALPELLASPEIQMFAARALHNPSLLLNLLRGSGLQLDRSNQQPEQQTAQQ